MSQAFLNENKMKVHVEGLANPKEYDERNLVRCRCGKHYYPSKKMFAEFLKKYRDVEGETWIWTEENWDKGEATIHVELKYKIRNMREKGIETADSNERHA